GYCVLQGQFINHQTRRARLGPKLTGLECTSLASRQAAKFAAARPASAHQAAARPTSLHRVVERLREAESVCPTCLLHFLLETKSIDMTSTDQERWRKVKDQFRSELGQHVFTSCFGPMELHPAHNE